MLQTPFIKNNNTQRVNHLPPKTLLKLKLSNDFQNTSKFTTNSTAVRH